MKTCSSCQYWVKTPGMRAAPNPATPGGGAIVDHAVGECHANPPTIIIVPVRTLQGDGMAPQPFRPFTLENAPRCMHYMQREAAEVHQLSGIKGQ